MTNEAVEELTTDKETAGKLNTFRQILEDIEKKQKELKGKLDYNDGGQNVGLIIKQRIDDLAKSEIIRGKNEGDTYLEAKRDGLSMASNIANQVTADFLNERLRIEGETRSLLSQAESVRDLYSKAVAESERKKRASEIAEEDRAIRQADMAAKEEKKKEETKKKRSSAAKKAAATRKKNKKAASK